MPDLAEAHATSAAVSSVPKLLKNELYGPATTEKTGTLVLLGLQSERVSLAVGYMNVYSDSLSMLWCLCSSMQSELRYHAVI